MRLGSVDANYYPSLNQILSAHEDDLKQFLSKTKKGNIVCLFKELILKFNEKESIQNDLNAIKISIKKCTLTVTFAQILHSNEVEKKYLLTTGRRQLP